MANGPELHPLQEAFAELGAAQCGYCTPGILLSGKALLDATPSPKRKRIREALSGNICRCTGYIKIFEAVELAAARMRAKPEGQSQGTPVGRKIEPRKESLYGYK